MSRVPRPQDVIVRLPQLIDSRIVLHLAHTLERGMPQFAVMGPAPIVDFSYYGRLSPDDILACSYVNGKRTASPPWNSQLGRKCLRALALP